LPDVAARIGEQIERLRTMRYPTMVIALDDAVPVSRNALRSAAQMAGLRAVAYRGDILKAEGSTVRLGAYLRTEFRDWLRKQARCHGGLLVFDVDELISTWPDSERRAFFMDFLHLESNTEDGLSRAPIVLASYHASRFSLPRDQRGQGIVWSPEPE